MQIRSEIRTPISWQVQVRTENGLRSYGYMVDLSSNGCCIEAAERITRVGSRLTVRPDGLSAMAATVQWIKGPQFGVKFDRPIYTPVLEHFIRKHATLASLVTLS